MGIFRVISSPMMSALYSISLFDCPFVNVRECMMMLLSGVTNTIPTPDDLSLLSLGETEDPWEAPLKNISQSFFICICMTFSSDSSI